MADILKSLLAAYQDDINDVQSQAGGGLTYIVKAYIVQAPEVLPMDWSADLPCILISPNSIPVEPDCLPGLADRKTYDITLSILKEGYGDETLGLFGDTHETGLLTMAQDLETLYRREKFSLSAACYLTQINYTLRKIPPYLHTGINQAHLTFRHEYLDMRG